MILGGDGYAPHGKLFISRTVNFYIGKKEAVLFTEIDLVRRISEYEPVFSLGGKCSLLKEQSVQRNRFLQSELILLQVGGDSPYAVSIQNIREGAGELVRNLFNNETPQTLFLFFTVVDDKAVAENRGALHDPAAHSETIEFQVVAGLVTEFRPEREAVGGSAERDKIIFIFMKLIQIVIDQMPNRFTPGGDGDFVHDFIQDTQYVLHFIDIVQKLRIGRVQIMAAQDILYAGTAGVMV